VPIYNFFIQSILNSNRTMAYLNFYNPIRKSEHRGDVDGKLRFRGKGYCEGDKGKV